MVNGGATRELAHCGAPAARVFNAGGGFNQLCWRTPLAASRER